MLKKFMILSLAAVSAASLAACAGKTDSSVKDESVNSTQEAVDASNGEELEISQGKPLPETDISDMLKAKGEKIDMTELVNKYKPLVKLADYKGIQVTKSEAYEMTDEEVDDELDILKMSFREYEDVTSSAQAQIGDELTMTTEALLDGQPYEEYSFNDQLYEVGSELIAEEFDQGLIGKKANEDFEVNVTFPDDYLAEEFLEEGETSLNGKTIVFKTKITKIERPTDETVDDNWVKAHKEDLKYYSYDGVNTLDELKTLIKESTEKNRMRSVLQDKGSEALSKVIENSEFSSFPEDEMKLLREQTISNIQQEFEEYKAMMEVESLEDYLKNAYDLQGESALEDYATSQAEDYLKNKMAVTLIADDAGIEIGEEDIKEVGNTVALYYGAEDYEALVKNFGENVRESIMFEAIYEKVITYLGKESDPSIEPDESNEMTFDLEESNEG